MISAAWRNSGALRCCDPTWNVTPLAFAAAIIAQPSEMPSVMGFTVTPLPHPIGSGRSAAIAFLGFDLLMAYDCAGALSNLWALRL